MSFKDAAVKMNNKAEARTENGMRARATTASRVLDFFSTVGSLRGKDAYAPFVGAYVNDENLALRALLWLRDIRGGAGERAQFRNILEQLETTNPLAARAIMHKIPELGRWDDILTYQEPENRMLAFEMISKALAEQNALCAKWMPRKGSVAVELREFLGLSPKKYRQLLVGLSNTVEQKMCAKLWKEINFSHVPSMASSRYQKAFGRNAPEEYSKYLRELQKDPKDRDPSVKINAGAIYPHTIIRNVQNGNAATANEQWNALPNYVGNTKVLSMVDVSGSMGWIGNARGGVNPIEVAVALGVYTAEKCTSDFKDLFLTFSEKPELVHLKGNLTQRIKQMSSANWGMNTNLNSAFDKILNVAVQGKVSQDDMPDVLLILSDMQFDRCTRFDDTAIKMIKRKYKEAGYEMPRVVFWNLADRMTGNQPVKFNKNGVALVSGFSPSIMKAVLANDLEDYTPYNVMMKTLMDSRYDF